MPINITLDKENGLVQFYGYNPEELKILLELFENRRPVVDQKKFWKGDLISFNVDFWPWKLPRPEKNNLFKAIKRLWHGF